MAKRKAQSKQRRIPKRKGEVLEVNSIPGQKFRVATATVLPDGKTVVRPAKEVKEPPLLLNLGC